MCLCETVIYHIDSFSGLTEERADLLGAHTNLLVVRASWAFGLVLGEHVFRSVHVLAEVEIVDFLSVAAVAVTANDQVEHGVAWRHDIQVFHYSQELLGSNVLRL